MAKLSDLNPVVGAFMRFYHYRSVPWGTAARVRCRLGEARLAVITTAALYLPEQEPFSNARAGDCSFREIPVDTDLAALRMGHKSHAFDSAGLECDRNLALPLDRLREMRAARRIGDVSPRHFSFMGSIMRPGPLIEETAPAVARLLAADAVDAVLLTPV